MPVGSGTFIDSTRPDEYDYEVLTASHVLEPITYITTETPPVRLCNVAQNLCSIVSPPAIHILNGDISTIGVDLRITTPARTNTRNTTYLELNTAVQVQGYPRTQLMFAPATVIGHDPEHTQLLTWCDYGTSGGGVFLRNTNKLVAVVIAIKSEQIVPDPANIQIPLNGICYVQTYP
jgi:hypothetical protein